MKPINLGRVAIATVVATILMFLGDGVVHGVFLKQLWVDVVRWNGHNPPDDPGRGVGYHVLYDLAKAAAVAFLYAAMRPRFGKGPKTALIAGVIVWGLAIPTALCGLVPTQFFPRMFLLKWSLFALVPTLIAAVAAGALYKEND
jgi:hypothetical protein